MAAQIPKVILMLVLLAGSAFFSGAETAFFNLSRRQVRLLESSKGRLQKLAASLLKKPGPLLNCFLFGNMTVNVLYYAVASVLTIRLRDQSPLAAATAAFLSFAALVLFGEIVPKSIAYANSRSLSVAAAVPAFLCLEAFAPLEFVFKVFVLEPALRLLLGPARGPRPITIGEFRSLIETIRKQGLITADENRLLGEVIELGFLKVRHVMRPRVDMVACAVTDPSAVARQKMEDNGLTKLPLYVKTIDNIVGLVHLRDILLSGDDAPLDRIVQEVHFVPEQKTVESLLEFFKRSRTDTAIVVDEYGGIAGSVSLEDVAEELLGQIEPVGLTGSVEQMGPFEYRLAGNLAVHDWAEVFGIDLAETRQVTIGGLVTALLGKVPKPGDVAYLKNLKFTVERVQKRRIETLVLTLEPFRNHDP